jgi:hypothetical protein
MPYYLKFHGNERGRRPSFTCALGSGRCNAQNINGKVVQSNAWQGRRSTVGHIYQVNIICSHFLVPRSPNTTQLRVRHFLVPRSPNTTQLRARVPEQSIWQPLPGVLDMCIATSKEHTSTPTLIARQNGLLLHDSIPMHQNVVSGLCMICVKLQQTRALDGLLSNYLLRITARTQMITHVAAPLALHFTLHACTRVANQM